MRKPEKQQVVEELSQAFSASSGVLLVDFTGINVADETELRRKVAEVGGSYRVVKNRLAVRAARESTVGKLEEYFQGPTAVALSESDPVALAKALTEFLKTHPNMSVKAGVLEQSVLSQSDVESLANMESREELLSKLVFLLQAPVRNLMGALQSPLRNLASVLKQLEAREK